MRFSVEDTGCGIPEESIRGFEGVLFYGDKIPSKSGSLLLKTPPPRNSIENSLVKSKTVKGVPV